MGVGNYLVIVFSQAHKPKYVYLRWYFRDDDDEEPKPAGSSGFPVSPKPSPSGSRYNRSYSARRDGWKNKLKKTKTKKRAFDRLKNLDAEIFQGCH